MTISNTSRILAILKKNQFFIVASVSYSCLKTVTSSKRITSRPTQARARAGSNSTSHRKHDLPTAPTRLNPVPNVQGAVAGC